MAQKREWRRYIAAAIAVLGAFGVFSAIGTNVVNDIFPSLSEKITGTGPLRVSVRRAVGAGDGFTMATWSPRGLGDQLRGVDGCKSLFAAAREADAADVGRSINDIVVEGSTHRDVTIVDLRAQIVDRRPPMQGAEIGCASAGAVGAIGVSFDFDEPQPVARRVSEKGDNGMPYFERGNVITLKQGEIQPIQVTATATMNYVAWNLIADLVVDGESERIKIDDEGRPFQITAGRPGLRFKRYYQWLWFEMPQRLYVSGKPFS